MAIAHDNKVKIKILELLGVEDTKVIDAHIHMKANSCITIELTRYATRKDDSFITTEEGDALKKEMKKYILVEKEQEAE